MATSAINWMLGKSLPQHNMTTDVALLLLRLWAGAVMVFAHGIPKVGMLGAEELKFADPLGLGPELSLIATVVVELGCAALLAFGFLSRVMLIPLIFTFLVIVFAVKINAPFKEMELALSFLVIYIALFLTGPGRVSIDQLVFSRAKTEQE